MLFHVISLCLIGLGAFLISLALSSARKLLADSPFSRNGWKTIFILTICFLACYIGLTFFLAIHPLPASIELAFSILLFCGALFVKLILMLSQRSLSFSSNQTQEAEYKSRHDELTSLPNRRDFLININTLIDSKTPFTLLIIDLNKFKQINDALGHLRGDDLLRQVSNRLDPSASSQTLFRVGGDEFSLIELNVSDAEQTAAHLLVQLEEPFILNGTAIDMSASIGIANYPEHGTNETIMISHADMAMYSAKRKGAGYQWFETQLDTDVQRRLEISTKLRTAVKSDQLQLYYQPIFDSHNHDIHSVEALIRWPVRNGEFITPAEFIPIAEEERQVDVITNWVLRAACKQLAIWSEQGHQLKMNINLSMLDIQDEKLWNRVQVVLKDTGIKAEQLVFEITESAMLNDLDRALATLHEIHNGGASIALDDFGTGYSSLSRLKIMPINQIKVDRCFVMGLEKNSQDAAIVNATVYLANTLHCSVTAEGVETERSAAILRTLGCHYLQGFHLARPMPAEQMTELLAAQKRETRFQRTGT